MPCVVHIPWPWRAVGWWSGWWSWRATLDPSHTPVSAYGWCTVVVCCCVCMCDRLLVRLYRTALAAFGCVGAFGSDGDERRNVLLFFFSVVDPCVCVTFLVVVCVVPL